MNNLQPNGWDFTDLKYINIEGNKKKLLLLEKGDILFNRTNSKELVGKCEVFKEDGEWIFASYLIRVRLDKDKALPDFVSEFLNTKAGRIQIDRISRQIIGMTNVNAEELRDLLIPLPPLPIQEKLVEEMERARESRRRKLSEADALLSTLDGWLLDTLGITPPPEVAHKVFAVRLNDVIKTARLNSDYFHPERLLAVRNIEQQHDRISVAPLHSVVDFIRSSRKSPTGRYLGLANVQSHTGEFVNVDEKVEGNVLAFAENDVLFGRLRPYLNKVYRAEFAGECSPEFHVMRTRNDKELNADYLAVILRSSIILAQTKHMMTGNTHPRLTNEDVVNLVIPIPSIAIQNAVGEEIRKRKVESRRLKSEAESEWLAAKDWFEAQLLRK